MRNFGHIGSMVKGENLFGLGVNPICRSRAEGDLGKCNTCSLKHACSLRGKEGAYASRSRMMRGMGSPEHGMYASRTRMMRGVFKKTNGGIF